MTRVWIALATVVLTAAVVGSLFGSSVDRDRYVAANEVESWRGGVLEIAVDHSAR